MAKLTKDCIAQISDKQNAEFKKYKNMLMVCTGTGCVSTSGIKIKDKLNETLKAKKMDADYIAIGTGCNGFCAVGPIIVVQPEGIFYQKVTLDDVEEIIESHLKNGKVVERLLHKNPVSGAINENIEDISFFTKQQLIALRNKG